jgi:hypothetical protein
MGTVQIENTQARSIEGPAGEMYLPGMNTIKEELWHGSEPQAPGQDFDPHLHGVKNHHIMAKYIKLHMFKEHGATPVIEGGEDLPEGLGAEDLISQLSSMSAAEACQAIKQFNISAEILMMIAERDNRSAVQIAARVKAERVSPTPRPQS